MVALSLPILCNQGVGGSNPSAGTNTPSVYQAVSLFFLKEAQSFFVGGEVKVDRPEIMA
jgi:hypothetical protein